MKSEPKLQSKFLKEWILFNIVGWFLGLICSWVLYINVPVWDFVHYKTLRYLLPIIMTFPLGIGLGCMQQFKLRKWKISGLSWTLATTLGFGIPWTLVSWVISNNSIGPLVELCLLVAGPIVVGASIGGFQVFLLRKSVPGALKLGSWIRSYIIGLLALGIVETIIYMIPVAIFNKSLLRLFKDWGWWGLIIHRDLILFSFIGLTIPLFAAIFIGLPTGRILQRIDHVKEMN
jgi:hypothetical protein